MSFFKSKSALFALISGASGLGVVFSVDFIFSSIFSASSANVEAKEELVGKIEEKIKTTENPNAQQSDASEIKTNTADLDLKKDTNIGMSDLKKP